jgi:hypothetical protein
MSFARDAARAAASRNYAVASRDSMIGRAEERARATGQSLDEAAAGVVEDLERAAAALSARTAPLVPACGVLVAVAGLLLKAGPSRDGVAEVFLGFAVLFALVGLSFLARGQFIYAGRRTIGLCSTVDDIAFARDRLVRKQACTHRGGWLAAIALACLIVGILVGVQITLGTG